VHYKPVQLSVLAWLLGGFLMVRVWHFAAMLSLVSFIPGHLIMVALHGWSNFYSMLIGWKQNPEPLTLSTHKTQAIGDLNRC
jgi:thiosulfate reductase cytochrome b subunit